MNTTEFYDTIATMPPLPHSQPDGSFDLMESEVLEWIVSRPEVRQWLFAKLNAEGAIVFDPATRKWKGERAVPPEAKFTAEEMLQALGRRSMTFTEWQVKCVEVYGRPVGHWAFVRAIQPLTSSGAVYKTGTKYRASEPA